MPVSVDSTIQISWRLGFWVGAAKGGVHRKSEDEKKTVLVSSLLWCLVSGWSHFPPGCISGCVAPLMDHRSWLESPCSSPCLGTSSCWDVWQSKNLPDSGLSSAVCSTCLGLWNWLCRWIHAAFQRLPQLLPCPMMWGWEEKEMGYGLIDPFPLGFTNVRGQSQLWFIVFSLFLPP